MRRSWRYVCVLFAAAMLWGCGDILVEGDGKTDTASSDTSPGNGDSDESGSDESGSYSVVPQTMWNNVVALSGCGCNDETEACNQDGTCVPRCDEMGRCLHAVFDGYVRTLVDLKGYSLYLKEYDDIERSGEETQPFRYWFVDLKNNTKVVVKEGDDDIFEPVDFTADGQLLAQNERELAFMSALGQMRYVNLPSGTTSHSYGEDMFDRVSSHYLYSFGDFAIVEGESTQKGLWRVALDGEYQIEPVLTADILFHLERQQLGEISATYDDGYHVQILGVSDEAIAFEFLESKHLCIYQVASSADTIVCIPSVSTADTEAFFGRVALKDGVVGNALLFASYYGPDFREDNPGVLETLGANGDRRALYTMEKDNPSLFYDAWGPRPDAEEFMVPGSVDPMLIDYDFLSTMAEMGTLGSYDGWLYTFEPASGQVIGIPVDAPSAVQNIYPMTMAPPEAFGVRFGSSPGIVDEVGMVWRQVVTDSNDNLLHSLIVSIPLPPRSCSTAIPCVGEGETCGTQGFCVKETVTDTGTDTVADTDTTDSSRPNDGSADGGAGIDEAAVVPQTMWNNVVALSGCGCNDETEACNEDGTCVPRCDEMGRCLQMVFDGYVNIMPFLDGYSLYVQELNQWWKPQDEWLTSKSWWVDLKNNSKLMVNDGSGDLRHAAGVSSDGQMVYPGGDRLTFLAPSGEISTYKLFGTVIDSGNPAGCVLSENYIYGFGDYVTSTGEVLENTIWRIAQDGDHQRELIFPGETMIALEPDLADAIGGEFGIGMLGASDDVVGFYLLFTQQLCLFEVGASPDTVMCIPARPGAEDTFGARAYLEDSVVSDRLIYLERSTDENDHVLNTLAALDVDGNQQALHTWDGDHEEIEYASWGPGVPLEEMLQDGFHYLEKESAKVSYEALEGPWHYAPFMSHDGWVYDVDPVAGQMIGFPVVAPNAVQNIFPITIAPPEAFGARYSPYRGHISEAGFVWRQVVDDGTGTVLRSHIVSMPLPPRPCGVPIPCVGKGETCGPEGFCVKN
ncbi:MAG: hypothetical protein JXX14_09025 [Deltaproteobacteria bacterium]|nr:hypothetical protein [Deltaproteobacteria bacterium]